MLKPREFWVQNATCMLPVRSVNTDSRWCKLLVCGSNRMVCAQGFCWKFGNRLAVAGGNVMCSLGARLRECRRRYCVLAGAARRAMAALQLRDAIGGAVAAFQSDMATHPPLASTRRRRGRPTRASSALCSAATARLPGARRQPRCSSRQCSARRLRRNRQIPLPQRRREPQTCRRASR